MHSAILATLLTGASLHFANVATAATTLIEQSQARRALPDESIRVADKRDYRHCHNFHTRTHCHKRDRLPQNWPPNSDTPAR